MGGNFALEWVATLPWNGWQLCAGTGGNFTWNTHQSEPDGDHRNKYSATTGESWRTRLANPFRNPAWSGLRGDLGTPSGTTRRVVALLACSRGVAASGTAHTACRTEDHHRTQPAPRISFAPIPMHAALQLSLPCLSERPPTDPSGVAFAGTGRIESRRLQRLPPYGQARLRQPPSACRSRRTNP